MYTTRSFTRRNYRIVLTFQYTGKSSDVYKIIDPDTKRTLSTIARYKLVRWYQYPLNPRIGDLYEYVYLYQGQKHTWITRKVVDRTKVVQIVSPDKAWSIKEYGQELVSYTVEPYVETTEIVLPPPPTLVIPPPTTPTPPTPPTTPPTTQLSTPTTTTTPTTLTPPTTEIKIYGTDVYTTSTGRRFFKCPKCGTAYQLDPPPEGFMYLQVVTKLYCEKCGTLVAEVPNPGWKLQILGPPAPPAPPTTQPSTPTTTTTPTTPPPTTQPSTPTTTTPPPSPPTPTTPAVTAAPTSYSKYIIPTMIGVAVILLLMKREQKEKT